MSTATKEQPTSTATKEESTSTATKKEWQLTAQGEDILKNGSYEYRFIRHLGSLKGPCVFDTFTDPETKIGIAQAIKAGWVIGYQPTKHLYLSVDLNHIIDRVQVALQNLSTQDDKTMDALKRRGFVKKKEECVEKK
jgi:hypothetical protein